MVKTYFPRQQHGHHPRLDLPPRGQFPFGRGDFAIHAAHGFHFPLSPKRIFPLSNTDIIPALTSRTVDSFPSSAMTSASMSFRVSTYHYSLSTFYQPHLPPQQHGHHPRLDLPRRGQFAFQRGDFGVHVAQDFGDGGLFRERWKENFGFSYDAVIQSRNCASFW